MASYYSTTSTTKKIYIPPMTTILKNREYKIGKEIINFENQVDKSLQKSMIWSADYKIWVYPSTAPPEMPTNLYIGTTDLIPYLEKEYGIILDNIKLDGVKIYYDPSDNIKTAQRKMQILNKEYQQQPKKEQQKQTNIKLKESRLAVVYPITNLYPIPYDSRKTASTHEDELLDKTAICINIKSYNDMIDKIKNTATGYMENYLLFFPNVTLLKHADYNLRSKPTCLDVIGFFPVNMSKIGKINYHKALLYMQSRIIKIIQFAIQEGLTELVVPDHGYTTTNISPELVAQCYHFALIKTGYHRYFNKISFISKNNRITKTFETILSTLEIKALRSMTYDAFKIFDKLELDKERRST